MKRRVGFGIVAGMLVALVLAAPVLIEAQAKKLLTIASGWVVGAYYPMAGGMSRIVHTKLPGVRVTVESSGASVANAKLVAAGDADLAILQNDIAFYAWNGQLMFKDQPIRNMVGIFSLHPEPVQVLATAASGIKSVKDMKGKRVSTGSGSAGITRQKAAASSDRSVIAVLLRAPACAWRHATRNRAERGCVCACFLA